MSKASPLFDDFIESVKLSSNRGSISVPNWICSNFQNPKNPQKAWSFDDHEFQIEILECDDSVQELNVEKCAQVGLSTIQVMSLLAFSALHDSLKAAYILPTAKFAQEFTQLRIDPIIAESPRVASIVSPDIDNKSAKKVGSSYVVFKGTSGETQAISIDLDMMVVDEHNFCNQKVLSSFSSRMQHSDYKLKRNFSTPTQPKFGISGLAEKGSKGRYLVKCSRCNTWTAPEFFRDIRGSVLSYWMDRFDKDITSIRPDDIESLTDTYASMGTDPAKDIYMACPHCNKSIEADLRNKERRAWVHAHPHLFDYGKRSYAVKPFDLMKYNPADTVLLSMKDYMYGDWINFRLGNPYASAEDSFMVDTIKGFGKGIGHNLLQLMPRIGETGTASAGLGRSYLLNKGIGSGLELFIGADLGKMNNIVVGVAVDNKLKIIAFGRVGTVELTQRYGEANFGMYLTELFMSLRGTRMVEDSAPSYEPALHCYAKLPLDTAFGSYYVQRGTGKPDIYTFKDGQGVVNICRTEHFDELAAEVNSGKVIMPVGMDGPAGAEELSLFYQHLDNLRKIKVLDSKGQTKQVWEAQGPDHYTHALGYCYAAYASVAKRFKSAVVLPFPGVSSVKLR
jgi:hypothetical protein